MPVAAGLRVDSLNEVGPIAAAFDAVDDRISDTLELSEGMKRKDGSHDR